MKNKDLINLKGFKPKMFNTDNRNYMSIETFNKIMDWLEKEVILDEAECKYLSDVCRPYEVIRIQKVEMCKEGPQFIRVTTKGRVYCEFFELPTFKAGTMYKGMDFNKSYSPSELGITCKDNE